MCIIGDGFTLSDEIENMNEDIFINSESLLIMIKKILSLVNFHGSNQS